MFDYEELRVVGLVDDKLGDNATIDVIGYCDDNLQEFHSYNASEIVDLFPTRGKVFAYKFSQYHKELKGSIVCLCVKPSNNNGPENYVWDWDADVIEYGKRIKLLKGTFSEDGQYNYNILNLYNLLDVEDEVFVYSSNKIYQIIPDNDDRVIKYWNENSLKIITYNGKKYFVGLSLPKHDGLLDITNDEQLAKWYLSKIVKKNWMSIIEGQTFRNSEVFLKDVLNSLKNLDEPTIRSRYNRLKRINTNISLTFENLKEIAYSPWFGEIINNSIEKERIHLYEELKKENNAQVQKIMEEYKISLLKLKQENDKEADILKEKLEKKRLEFIEQEKIIETKIQEKQLEIEILDEKKNESLDVVVALEASIANLKERKSSVIKDFEIIKEVLGASTLQEPNERKVKEYILEEINYSNNPIIRFQAYVKSLENILKVNNFPQCSTVALARILAKFNIVICPSQSIAQAYILASHKCKYISEYVSAKWKSFDDLWNNGLEYIVDKSLEDSSTMHFLLLQNINISYLPNYLQPIVDLQKGIISRFPATNKIFPKNLRILCTISDDELIPMSESILRNVGCVDRAIKFELTGNMKYAEDDNLGYLTPEELNLEKGKNLEIENIYKQYLDE